jgi:diaminopimelate epimerase
MLLQVCVDMGEPILEGPKVPTTLAPTQGSTVVQQTLTVEGRSYEMTCVSMGNPHAITYTVDGQPIKVRWGCSRAHTCSVC